MKSKLTFILLFCSVSVSSQFSTDSLIKELTNNYSQNKKVGYLNYPYTEFVSKDSLDKYHLFLDSNDSLIEKIGLSIVHYQYDSLNRIKIIEGFNKAGKPYYWDFPVKEVYNYYSDTSIKILNRVFNDICKCDTNNSVGKIKTIDKFNKDLSMYKRTITLKSNDGLKQLEFSKDTLNNVLKRSKSSYYRYRKFDKKYKNMISHERYYDKNLKLVSGKYSAFQSRSWAIQVGIPYSYSIRKVSSGIIVNMKFYDENDKLVHEYNKYSGGPFPTSGVR